MLSIIFSKKFDCYFFNYPFFDILGMSDFTDAFVKSNRFKQKIQNNPKMGLAKDEKMVYNNG